MLISYKLIYDVPKSHKEYVNIILDSSTSIREQKLPFVSIIDAKFLG
jgi:hypothetical protein